MYLTFVDNKMKIVLCKFSNSTLFFIRQEIEGEERDSCIRRERNKGKKSIRGMNNETKGEGKRLERERG